MGEFDKTKKAIGVGGMDDKDRQAMFNKFRSAGGEIVTDKEKEAEAERERVRQSKSPQSKKPSSDRSSSDSKQQDSSKNDDSTRQPSKLQLKSKIDLEAQMGNFLNRLLVKFKCWAGRVTPFGASELLPEFLSELNFESKNALIDLRMASLEIIGSPGVASKIAANMDKVNPAYVELLGKGYDIYDSNEYAKFAEVYNPDSTVTVPISKVVPELYSIFKKIYYLYSFQGTYKKALLFGYDQLQKIENKPAIIYTTKKKKVTHSLSIVFDKLFQKLYLIVLRNENKNIPMISFFMEDLIGILEEEKPGKRRTGDPLPISSANQTRVSEETLAAVKEEEEVSDEEFMMNLSVELRIGLNLMAMLTPEEFRQKYDQKNEIGLVPLTDRALLAYLFFREFDYEYSFVLTTKKINYKVTSDKNTPKIDYRHKLLDLYESSRGCVEQYRIYKEIYEEAKKIRENPSSNYIDASKKLSLIEQKRTQQSRNVKVTIKEFVEKTKDILGIIVKDIRTTKAIVTNPSDLIVFDSIESRKRMHKKQAKQCIMEAYCFSLALFERLSNGDLSSHQLEMTPEEMSKSFDVEIPVSEDEIDVEKFYTSSDNETSPNVIPKEEKDENTN
jgi:hypothetical protein